MNQRIHRFDFGAVRDFRGPLVSTAPKDIAVELPSAPPPPPTFNEAEMDAARMSAKAKGYEEGFAAGTAQARSEANQKHEDATQVVLSLKQEITTLTQRYEALLTQESSQLSELVMAIARKVAGEALQARDGDTIAALVQRCLPVIFSRPRLTVDLHPDTLKTVADRIETLLIGSGYEGEIQFRSAPELGVHDARLDWGAGQANRSTASLWQEIESLLARIPLEQTFQQTLTKTQNPGE